MADYKFFDAFFLFGESSHRHLHFLLYIKDALAFIISVMPMAYGMARMF